MRTSSSPALLVVALAAVLLPACRHASDGERWWRHVEFLASDRLEGREAGSPGHRAAAEYVAARLKALGVAPAGDGTYFQRVPLELRRVDETRTRLTLTRDGGQARALVLGDDVVVSARAGLMHAPVDAPLVFAGYGLHLPEVGHDDLAGLDVRGKVVLVLTGGPKALPGPLKAHAGSLGERWKALKAAGAVGVVTVQHPRFMDSPWERSAAARQMPSMVLADPALRDADDLPLALQLNPARADVLLEGSGTTFQQVLEAADAERPLPRMALATRLRAEVAITTAPAESVNVAGVLRGSDPALRGEYVVMTAHLDHVGVGAPVNGDRIYNGALDNASGSSALLEIARLLKDAPPRRSVLFLAVTAEEKGLLGSRFFAARPTVPAAAIAANVNVDMFLPLFPLQVLVAYGLEESTLEASVRAAAEAAGVQVGRDPEPNRNAFVRSDQYSFVRAGVPAVALKFGAPPGSPEEAQQKAWLRAHYHAPSDDLAQPLDREAAGRFVRLAADVVRRTADAPERPRWNDASFFRRFAPAQL